MEERNPRASALGRGDDAHLSLGAAKVLVAAVTCQRNADRVAACSQTWVPLLERDWGIPTLFVQGDPNQAEEARFDPVAGVLTLRVADTYEALAAKSQALFAWVLACTDFDYVFKCDDDTYLYSDVFAQLRPTPYLGSPLWIEAGEAAGPVGVRYASGGAGYLLDREAMRVIVEDPLVPGCPFEDVAVGRSLAGAGVELSLYPRYAIAPELRYFPANLARVTLSCETDLGQRPSAHLQRQPAESMRVYHAFVTALTADPSPAHEEWGAAWSALTRYASGQGALVLSGVVVENDEERWLLARSEEATTAHVLHALEEHGWFVSSEAGLLWSEGRCVGVPSRRHGDCPHAHARPRPLTGVVFGAGSGMPTGLPTARLEGRSAEEAVASLVQPGGARSVEAVASLVRDAQVHVVIGAGADAAATIVGVMGAR